MSLKVSACMVWHSTKCMPVRPEIFLKVPHQQCRKSKKTLIAADEKDKLLAKYEQLLAIKNEQDINFTEMRREMMEKHRAESGVRTCLPPVQSSISLLHDAPGEDFPAV